MKPTKKSGGKSKRLPTLVNRRDKAEPKNPVSVVGVGASAGGLEAFRTFLDVLPAKTGVAYVLVQHLDPHHESMLSVLLARTAQIPVVEVTNRTHVKPDHVYVIPPGKNMSLEGNLLILSARSKQGDIPNMPIDHFFRSLASARAGKAVGVILSGTASDGTIGLGEIKEAGGLTFVQDSTAKYQGMPQSAIAAGVADYVLPPQKIAEELVAVAQHPMLKNPGPRSEDEAMHKSGDYHKIIGELRRATGADFSNYKVTTLSRRITRRMVVNKKESAQEYLQLLRGNNKEAEALFNDILINVTGFFRDPLALQCLAKKVLPQLVKSKSSKEPLRVWVAGCSTGEEVYSLAITLLEFLGDRSVPASLQIFGTDLSSIVIDRARRGTYTKSEVGSVAPRRLERFFLKSNGSYQIRKDIRDMCVFSVHNLLKDPPFSRIDILSCCNLLIYMDATLQRRVFSSFHYALAPHGVLILGKSETVGAAPGLFSQVEKKSKVFTKKTDGKRAAPPVVPRGDSAARTAPVPKREAHGAVKTDMQVEADSILLGRFSPASVLINDNFEIVQLWGDTQGYLKLPSGKATLNLLKITRGDLIFELRDAIQKAKKTGVPVKKEIPPGTGARSQAVVIDVIPIKKDPTNLHFLVVFESVFPKTELVSPPQSRRSGSAAESRRSEQLERELAHARENARSIAEEQEAAVEELQSANEEILSSNEELQSINEELETSTEELESTNEELNTVNQELQTRNEELSEARDYAESIVSTIHNPLLILDKELRVRTTNQAFCKSFKTTKEETEGHFLYNLGNGQWDIPELRTLLGDILPRNNAVYDYEIVRVFPHIGHRVFHLNAHILDQKGERKLILLAFEDVTEELEINRQKDDFIGIAAHEIKTPITSIKTFTELLQQRLTGSDKKEYAKILEHIVTQSDRLTTLVTDLLSFSQMQSDKFLLNKEEFDLDRLIEHTVEALQQSTRQHTIVKEGKLHHRIVADASRIEQVLINLLTNAVKYSPQGKRVIVRVEELPGEAVVSVKDFGAGIPKKDHKTIFDRFYRGHEAVRIEENAQSKGFGLGLYICAQIIQKHDGTIWVESQPGQGSTFYFTLPLPQKAKLRPSRS